MPNLIHSLDGSTISLLYDQFNADLYTVHDCFAVPADKVPYLIKKLQLVYIKLYSSNKNLIQFDNSVRLNIKTARGDKTISEDGKYIYLSHKKGVKKTLYPDVNKILLLDSTNNLNNSVSNITKS